MNKNYINKDTRSEVIDSVNNNFKFSGGWISGFIQSDGCFTITFEKRKTGLNIRPKPIFVLTQDISEKELFKSLHKFLGVGYITTTKTNVSLYITSLSDLKNVLFPILEEHPLKYGKLRAYLIFKALVEEMLNKRHLKLEGLLSIIYTSFKLNSATGRRTEESKDNLLKFLESKNGKLPEPLLIEAPLIAKLTSSNLSLDFLAGLIDGDGSFNVAFQIKPYRRVRVNFTVVQETSCKGVLDELKSYFSCGNVYSLPSAANRYQVENVDLILNNIKPVLDKLNLNTYKAECYQVAIKVCEIIKNKGYKSNHDFKEIVELAYNSNKLGKRRRITKEELIRKIDEVYPQGLKS